MHMLIRTCLKESCGLKAVMRGSRTMFKKISSTMSSAVCQSSPNFFMSNSISAFL